MIDMQNNELAWNTTLKYDARYDKWYDKMIWYEGRY